jgi:hypothetical protein
MTGLSDHKAITVTIGWKPACSTWKHASRKRKWVSTAGIEECATKGTYEEWVRNSTGNISIATGVQVFLHQMKKWLIQHGNAEEVTELWEEFSMHTGMSARTLTLTEVNRLRMLWRLQEMEEERKEKPEHTYKEGLTIGRQR